MSTCAWSKQSVTPADHQVQKVNVLPRGLEPRTLGLLDLRSDQLSYESLRNAVFEALLNVARDSHQKIITPPAGIEPATFRLTAERSNH